MQESHALARTLFVQKFPHNVNQFRVFEWFRERSACAETFGRFKITMGIDLPPPTWQ